MKLTLISIALVMTLAACGKAKEAASQKVTEKIIESSLSQDGTKAKVDMSSGGMKVTSTDASGKTTQMEMGSAKVTEAEAGIAFYPGAQMKEGAGTRMTSSEGSYVTVGLSSTDATEKVAAFYRDKLEAGAAGGQFTDMDMGDGNHMISAANADDKGAIQVTVQKADKGSEIQIVATKGIK